MRAYNNSQGTHRRESRAQFFNILPSACTIFAPFRRALSLFILRLKINISHRNNGSQLCLYPRLYMHTASFLRCCLSPFIWRWLSPQKIPPANRLITNIDNEETIVWTLPDDYVCNSCRFCFFSVWFSELRIASEWNYLPSVHIWGKHHCASCPVSISSGSSTPAAISAAHAVILSHV